MTHMQASAPAPDRTATDTPRIHPDASLAAETFTTELARFVERYVRAASEEPLAAAPIYRMLCPHSRVLFAANRAMITNALTLRTPCVPNDPEVDYELWAPIDGTTVRFATVQVANFQFVDDELTIPIVYEGTVLE